MSSDNKSSRRDVALMAAAGVVAAALPAAAKPAPPAHNISDADLKALIAAHDKAFANQDLQGVLATLSPQVVIMGTAPGELWVGPRLTWGATGGIADNVHRVRDGG